MKRSKKGSQIFFFNEFRKRQIYLEKGITMGIRRVRWGLSWIERRKVLSIIKFTHNYSYENEGVEGKLKVR